MGVQTNQRLGRKEPNDDDYRSRLPSELSTNCLGRHGHGELQERRPGHREEAETFYRELNTQGAKVRVGMEASGHARWFERLMGELNFELWIGDAAEIRTKRVQKQRRIVRMHS